MQAHTPLLKQYFAMRERYPGVLLAMRVGDFYEFYGPDAETAAEVLQITLTGREDGPNGRVPMAGVPYHAAERYVARLLRAGYRVALCDQVEDPKTAKGLVRRAVTRVLTPGTLVEDAMLPEAQSNYLGALCRAGDLVGLAVLDPSTGELAATEIGGEKQSESVLHELARLRPAELLAAPGTEEWAQIARATLGLTLTPATPPEAPRAEAALRRRFGVSSLAGFGADGRPAVAIAVEMVLAYAEGNGLTLDHVDALSVYHVSEFLTIDPATRRSLEITQNLTDGTRRNTLLGAVDRCLTAMGSRLLRRWLEQPLLDRAALLARQDAVERLASRGIARGDLRERLKGIGDLERLVGRCATRTAGPRDLAAIRRILEGLPALAEELAALGPGRLQELRADLGDHEETARTLARALVDEPPATLREGGVIRDGYDEELDQLRSLAREGRSTIAALEARERERTGLPQLKVGFNNVFGYYLELPKSLSERAPAHYVRKQTTAAAERYVTAELKELEAEVLGAGEKALALEAELFARLRDLVAERSGPLLRAARALAEIDVLAGAAEVAVERHYARPEIVDEDVLEIEEGRHPVVEIATPAFVANDLRCTAPDADDPTRLVILTGPNMSGKSTYLRQAALIVVLAQAGLFVPARRCRLGLCDRLFARIGARDELALGQSTFMVEMLESAHILNNATSRSLVILDEVGRGTSTYDGLAIAWAMAERLHEIGAKTLFATHYHPLNRLADERKGVKNFRMSVEELGDDIVWTHRVLPGGTDRSYGIHVARMAGVPLSVVRRAGEILRELEKGGAAPAPGPRRERLQLTLFEAEEPEVLRELGELDVDALTPLQALQLLDSWKKRYGAAG